MIFRECKFNHYIPKTGLEGLFFWLAAFHRSLVAFLLKFRADIGNAKVKAAKDK